MVRARRAPIMRMRAFVWLKADSSGRARCQMINLGETLCEKAFPEIVGIEMIRIIAMAHDELVCRPCVAEGMIDACFYSFTHRISAINPSRPTNLTSTPS